MVPVAEQFSSFFYTIIVGLILGIIIDIYRSVHFYYRPPNLLITLGDLLLWLFLVPVAFFFLLLNNWGEVRPHTLFSIGLGLVIYRAWFSPWVFRFWRKFFYLLGKTFKFTLSILLFPFRLLKKILFIPLGLISIFLDWLRRLFSGLARFLKKYTRQKLRGIKNRIIPPKK